MNKKIKILFIYVSTLINGLLLSQKQKVVAPPNSDIEASDLISIKKIIVNGVSYTSSPITIYKNTSLTIQVDYTITKQTPSFQNSGTKAECYAIKSVGSNWTLFFGNGSFPVVQGESQNGSQTTTLSNSSVLIDSNNKGKIQMSYETTVNGGARVAFAKAFDINFVEATISNNTISGSITSNYMSTAPTITGSTASAPIGTLSYFWQRKNPGGQWYNISLNNLLVNTQSYTPPASQNQYNYKLRRAVQSNYLPTHYSNEIDVRVNIAQNSITEKLAENGNGSLNHYILGSLPKGGDNSFTYQWQEKTNSIWTNISGATNISYILPTINNSRFFRRIAKSSNVIDNISNELEIRPRIEGNFIRIDGYNQNIPNGYFEDEKVIAGHTPIFNRLYGTAAINTTGNPNSYQWQSKTQNDSWTNINGATQLNYNITSPIYESTEFRRLVISSGLTTNISNSIFFNVSLELPIQNNIISYENNASGTIIGSIPSGGNNNYKYVWSIDTHPDDSIGEFFDWSWSNTSSESINNSWMDLINLIPTGTSSEYRFVRYVISDGVWNKSNTITISNDIINYRKNNIIKKTINLNPFVDKNINVLNNNNELQFIFKNYENKQADIYISNYSTSRSEKIMKVNIPNNNFVQKWTLPQFYLPGVYIYNIIFNDGQTKSGKIIKK